MKSITDTSEEERVSATSETEKAQADDRGGLASTSAHVRRLKDRCAEAQANYEQLSRRIVALDRDLGNEIDGERRLILQDRRKVLVGERDQIAVELLGIEQQIEHVERGESDSTKMVADKTAPRQLSEQKAVPRGNRQVGVLEGVRALIIEDAVSQRLAIQQALSDLGAICVVVTDLDEALTYVRSDHFDLITLDMRLDLMDSEGQAGFLLLDQMRVYQERASVVVVSGLGWSARAVRDFFVRNKVADVFLKPVDLNEFRQRIQAIMAERGRND